MKAKMSLPADLIDFLESGKRLEYEPSLCEAGRVELYRAEELALQLFPTDMQGDRIAELDPHKGELGSYLVLAVDLIRSAMNCSPMGLLLWFPVEGRYGTWDSSHPWLGVFGPEVAWQQIAEAPYRFINAQWVGAFEDSERLDSLVPWPKHSYRSSQVFEPLRYV